VTAARVRQAFVGAGANLGDRCGAIAGAAAQLRAWPGIESLEVSPLFETEPVGVVDQPRFVNAVLGVETVLSPEELLRVLMTIEREFGRERRERWGPRTLDLDLLAFEGETRATPELTLPHPRMFERAFVMVPLRELLRRPKFEGGAWRALRERLETLPTGAAGVRKIEDGRG
jgi:2-amino-4-hydroxy-6-hydroxymethyldihydropteridine diphosphokinase